MQCQQHTYTTYDKREAFINLQGGVLEPLQHVKVALFCYRKPVDRFNKNGNTNTYTYIFYQE